MPPLRNYQRFNGLPSGWLGRPVIDGTSVRTEVIASRLNAGESIQTLAEGYGVGADRIEEAIRYELIAA